MILNSHSCDDPKLQSHTCHENRYNFSSPASKWCWLSQRPSWPEFLDKTSQSFSMSLPKPSKVLFGRSSNRWSHAATKKGGWRWNQRSTKQKDIRNSYGLNAEHCSLLGGRRFVTVCWTFYACCFGSREVLGLKRPQKSTSFQHVGKDFRWFGRVSFNGFETSYWNASQKRVWKLKK